MTKRTFCRVLLVVVAIFGVLAFTSVLSAQGNSENAFEHVRDVQEKHTDILMARSGVVGTAVGLNDDGEYAVLVLLEIPRVAGIPQEIEGVPVQMVVTGKILALTTERFDRPVPIGVSTGHPDITAGTIACRVKDSAGNVYALSNNHVYANSNEASLGDNVLQPGPFDGGVNPDDTIGTLFDFEPIVFSRKARNEIDAAIAISSTYDLGKATPAGAGGYGTPNPIIVDAFIGQQVQKFGRTTGLTIGEVTGVNATVNVGYGPGKTAKFVKQIIIEPGGFSAGGDSGSLIVTLIGNNPVGLLFAGSSTITVANRIDLVLDKFGVTVDGEEGPLPATGTIAGTVTSGGAAIEGATASVDTGQSATTAGDGSYTIADVPVGERSVTASADGFESQTQAANVIDGNTTYGVDFDLDPTPMGSAVSVSFIEYATEGGRNGYKHLSITVALEDDLGNPVADASLTIDLFRDGSLVGSGSSTTNADGTATFILKNAQSGTYTTTVTDVSVAELNWDGETPENSFTK